MIHFIKRCGVLCALLLMLYTLFACAAAQTDAQLWEAYQQPNVCVEGQAYLELVPSVQPVRITDGEMPIWRFSLFMTETNGIAFIADSVAFTRFDAEHNVLAHVTFEGNEYAASYMPGPEFLPGETLGTTINQPADRTTHYGIALGGTDANGNTCDFRILVPLSHDVLAAETVDAFRVPGEGSSLIELTPSADPVYLEEIEFFNGLGWASSLTVSNISDGPVTLTDMRMVIFTEGEGTLVQLDYSGEALAIFAGVESNVLAPGESISFSDICPYQDLLGYGYRFTAQAEDGSIQTANRFFACVKEEKPE